MGAALEPPEIALAGVLKTEARGHTISFQKEDRCDQQASKDAAAVMPPRTLAARGTIALARLGPIIPLLRPNRQLVRPPSSEGQHKCERSEALVGGDRRRTARATTADYLLWRAKGTALSLPPDDGQSLCTIALAPPATSTYSDRMHQRPKLAPASAGPLPVTTSAAACRAFYGRRQTGMYQGSGYPHPYASCP